MHVAIAGSGDMASYISTELLAASHTVTILARSAKPSFPNLHHPALSYKLVDFQSPQSLDDALSPCQALVSTILDYSLTYIPLHLALLSACQRSPHCKRFIPSEFSGNIDDYPNEPAFYALNHPPVRAALREQSDVEWTLLNVGWMSDYVLPQRSRYLKDIGAEHPVDLNRRTFVVPGTGDEWLDFTAARDVARAVVALCGADVKWEPTIYVRGERTTWNRIRALLETVPWGRGLELSYASKEELEGIVERKESEEAVLAAQFALFSVSGACLLPEEKMVRQKDTYFKDVKFRTNEEIMKEALAEGVIV